MMTLLRVEPSSSSISGASRVLSALAISGFTRSVTLAESMSAAIFFASCLDLVANRRDGLHHARARAIRARLAQHAFERLLGALARDVDQAEFVEGQHLRRRPVRAERVIERVHDLVAVAPLFHVDEVHDDDAAEIAQADLPHDFLHRFEVGLDDGVFEPRRAAPDDTCRC